MINVIENFLTPEECQYYIELIDRDNKPSGVTTQDENRTTTSEYRTSSTCNFPASDQTVSKLKNRIAEIVGLPEEHGEALQGQLYLPGQYFKRHTDFFEAGSYNNHCLFSGNRVKTLMIYLNDVEEGGGTYFEKLDKTFIPKQGTALLWDDMIDGKPNYDSMHEGQPVISGSKYIITSWWRENKWDGAEDARLSREYHMKKLEEQKQAELEKANTFSSRAEIPHVSELGYTVIKIPDKVWKLIREGYELLKPTVKEESFPGISNIISGSVEPPTIMSFDKFSSLRDLILEELKPVHEEWSKQNLTPSALYGIRSYHKGATLVSHVDRIETHHVSSIIIVDKDLDCGCTKTKGSENDWALEVVGHDGETHKVYGEIGEMILYESATCHHGRLEPFKGKYFRNLFAHYRITDLVYKQK